MREKIAEEIYKFNKSRSVRVPEAPKLSTWDDLKTGEGTLGNYNLKTREKYLQLADQILSLFGQPPDELLLTPEEMQVEYKKFTERGKEFGRWTWNKWLINAQLLKLWPAYNSPPEELRKELIQWITDYKDAAERNALAEDPDESADYLISRLWPARVMEEERIKEILAKANITIEEEIITELVGGGFSDERCSYIFNTCRHNLSDHLH